MSDYKFETVAIHGNDYVTVNERLKYFRLKYPDYSIETEILELKDKIVLMKAIIKNKEGRIISTAHSYELFGSSHINKTSYIENCETSVVGRCLAFMAIGIDKSIASAEEVDAAIKQQEKKPVKIAPTKKTPVKKEPVKKESGKVKMLKEAVAGTEVISDKEMHKKIRNTLQIILDEKMEVEYWNNANAMEIIKTVKAIDGIEKSFAELSNEDRLAFIKSIQEKGKDVWDQILLDREQKNDEFSKQTIF